MALENLNSTVTVPFDVTLEQAILGCIMKDNSVIANIAGRITEESFYEKKHQAIYKAMLDLYEDSVAVDEVTLLEKLRELNLTDTAGGFYYLADLEHAAPIKPNVDEYVSVIQKYYYMRKIFSVTTSISKKSLDPTEKMEDILSELEAKISEIYNLKDNYQTFHVKDAVTSVVSTVNDRSKLSSNLIGLETGFLEIDDITLGLQPSDLIVVAARPSMGKTSFALNIAYHVAANVKQPVHFFSLEMSKEQLAMRLLGAEANIASDDLKKGNLKTQSEWDRFYAAVDKVSKAPIHITDLSGVSMIELLAIAKSEARRIQPKLIVVDYLQLIVSSTKSGANKNREQEIAEVSRGLKALAKTLNIPVIAVSQLNRSPESRSNKRPMMSDIRESGAIEQDADIIMFLYRDEVYNKEQTNNKGIAEVIISKHRNGEIGTKKLAFIGKYTKFGNLASHPLDDSEFHAPY